MDKNLKRKIEKVTKNNGDVSLAQLESTIDLVDKLDELKQAVESIPETVIPETVIPEQKEVVFPDVQKVEIINHKEDKDDTEIKNLLKDLVAEVKKKEEYAYDIEIDSTLKEQLKGDDGYTPVKGKDYFDGRDGTEITGEEIAGRLESLEGEEKLDISAIKGAEELVLDIVNDKISKIKKPKIVGGFRDTSSSSGGLGDSFETVSANLSAYNYTITYNGSGDVDTITYDLGGGLEVVKTLNYTAGDVTSIVLSGDTPSGISLTKTLTYTSGDVTSIAYS